MSVYKKIKKKQQDRSQSPKIFKITEVRYTCRATKFQNIPEIKIEKQEKFKRKKENKKAGEQNKRTREMKVDLPEEG